MNRNTSGFEVWRKRTRLLKTNNVNLPQTYLVTNETQQHRLEPTDVQRKDEMD